MKLELFITHFHSKAATAVRVKKRKKLKNIFRYYKQLHSRIAQLKYRGLREVSRKLGNVSWAQILITRERKGQRVFIGDKLPRSGTLMSFSTGPLSQRKEIGLLEGLRAFRQWGNFFNGVTWPGVDPV